MFRSKSRAVGVNRLLCRALVKFLFLSSCGRSENYRYNVHVRKRFVRYLLASYRTAFICTGDWRFRNYYTVPPQSDCSTFVYTRKHTSAITFCGTYREALYELLNFRWPATRSKLCAFLTSMQLSTTTVLILHRLSASWTMLFKAFHDSCRMQSPLTTTTDQNLQVFFMCNC